jgi:hypothetical protein
MNIKYTDEQRRLALELRKNGEIVKNISIYLNVKQRTVEKWLSQKTSIKNLINDKICHQYKIRLETLQEDIDNGLPKNADIKDFSLTQESITDEHRDFIKRYEWLGTIGYGVRYVFVARYSGILGGVVMIANPNAYTFDIGLEALIQRGACASWTPKNLGSKLIMFACNWMVQNTSKRIFTAYSDPLANEYGTIYQACNFDYLGNKFGATKQFLLNEKWVTAQKFNSTTEFKKTAKILGIVWQKNWCKPNGYKDLSVIPKEVIRQIKDYGKNILRTLPILKVPSKGKYILLLGKNRRDTKQLQKFKSWVKIEYPKRNKNDC